MAHVSYPALEDAFASEHLASESAVDQIFALMRTETPWSYDYEGTLPVQLAALNERLHAQVEAIPMLGRRVEDARLDAVTDFDQALPLLFSTDIYKGYPSAFLTNEKWPLLLRWLEGFSAHRLTTEVDLAGVRDIDDFIGRVWATGNYLFTTSGTSGKCSMIPETAADGARISECILRAYGEMWGIDQTRRHPLFYLGHRSGPYRGAMILRAMSAAFGAPESTHALFEDTLSIAELNQVASISAEMGRGDASPSAVAALEANQRHAARRASQAIDRYIDLLDQFSSEPLYVWGQVYPLYLIMERCEEIGRKLVFQEGTAVIAGGGVKNNRLPDGYQDRLRDFYGSEVHSGYGQSEIHGLFPECRRGRWHVPPNILLLLVDPDRGRWVGPTRGTSEGLAAIFDISPGDRWGGILSSDWLTVDFAECGCGWTSPSVIDCHRYAGVISDKLDCQGRIEMYIRGSVQPS